MAWLHNQKGTLAVHPHVIIHNDRISVSDDSRFTYLLQLKDIKESDAGKYICQVNTGPPVSIGGALNVVGESSFSSLKLPAEDGIVAEAW